MKAVSLPALRILILAAGFSSRLGKPKALARINGVSLLRRTIIVAAGLRPAGIIVIVPRSAARYRIEARGIKVRFSINPHPARGLSSSVRGGIAAARYTPAVLLLPVDLAHLRRRDLEHLISRWQAAPRCVAARRIGHGGGTPLILPRWLYPRALTRVGDIGLRTLLDELPRHSVRLVEVPSAEIDVDTPQDLRAARSRRRSSSAR
jgi:molybdenum cofactor cytidylyltransferase